MNRISVLKKRSGDWCESEEETCQEIIDYFKQIFNLEKPDDFAEIFQGVQQTITAEMSKKLTRKVTDQKISHAVFSMQPNKSPGPDDDSLIFCKASVEEAGQLRRILDVYKQASGQLINVEKSSLFFSRNVSNRQREGVMRELQGIKQVLQSKYLGLPLVIRRSKRQVFDFIRQKTIARLKGWKQKLLSQAGKEVLLKSVIMALPTYVMSCCLLPKVLYKKICSKMAKYWWGQKENEHKVHWLSWGRMTEVKAEGGLGFQELHEFNLALLAKQLWRILTKPNLVVSKIMKAKKLLEEGIRKQVGDGKSINIWEDRWLPETEDGRVKTRNVEGIEVQGVSKLIKDGMWDKELIAQGTDWQKTGKGGKINGGQGQNPAAGKKMQHRAGISYGD
ncbi:uncharacterized protein LOC113752281 [Coffea eugenioides]|uniref:uncharacterized protein LOC113752281 n=1 Tax=Coffea eugenioides TaxID=49369 RepID=UPI000F604866|nr:uncharacterized protein LOC113752281 [Coffea eugenioides]